MANVGEVHHVAVSVSDLDSAIRFYGEGLGLRKTLDMPVGGANTWKTMALPEGTTGRSVFMQGPTRLGQLELVQWNVARREGDRPKRVGDLGPFALSFHCKHSEIDATHRRLLDMGVNCYTPPTTNVLTNYGRITVFFCDDPDGNMVEVIALPSDEEVREFRARTMDPNHNHSGDRCAK